MKKILVMFCLICSMSVSAETLNTDNPNRYLKNYTCNESGYAHYNAVNKTDTRWSQINFYIYDSDGDPIDNFQWNLSVGPNSGEKMVSGGLGESCKKLIGVKYKVKAW
ncbi:hypothetical protein OAH83_00245 [Methylophilaceae bacterium]|nr:hypothetical protein [Methylophilaceae bacterium]